MQNINAAVSSNVKKLNSKKYFKFLFLLLIFTFFFRVAQIWINPIQDFDTNSFILMMQGGFYPHFTSLIDLAHPGLLALFFAAAQSLITQYVIAPIYLWSISIALAMAVATLLFYLLLLELTESRILALIGTIAYLLSPAISDIAAKSEENIFFHSLFIFTLLTTYKYLNTGSNRSLGLLSICSIFLASLHIQPFLIVLGALFLYSVSEWLRSSTNSSSNLQNAIKALFAFATPGVLYYFVIHYAFYNPMVVTAYSNNIYSLFHNDSLPLYLEAFLLFLQGHLFTGAFPVISMTLLRIEPTLLALLIGFIFLLYVLSLLIRRTFLECTLLASLGFVFLYEPTISERWDTVLIALIACMFSYFSFINVSIALHKKVWILFPCAVVIALGLFRIPEELKAVSNAFKIQRDIALELTTSNKIFTNLDSGQRFAVNLSPRQSQFQNISINHPKADDLIFLENSDKFVQKQFNLNCQSTNIPHLCKVTSNN